MHEALVSLNKFILNQKKCFLWSFSVSLVKLTTHQTTNNALSKFKSLASRVWYWKLGAEHI